MVELQVPPQGHKGARFESHISWSSDYLKRTKRAVTKTSMATIPMSKNIGPLWKIIKLICAIASVRSRPREFSEQLQTIHFRPVTLT